MENEKNKKEAYYRFGRSVRMDYPRIQYYNYKLDYD